MVAKVLPLRKQVAEKSANNDEWPHALNSSLIRLFDVPTLNLEANAYYELAPAIASFTDREIEECLKETFGITPPMSYAICGGARQTCCGKVCTSCWI